MKNFVNSALLVTAMFCLSGCDLGLQTMGATEYGVRFVMLPPPLGGLSDNIVSKGQTVVVWPWERLVRVDTAVRTVEWGEIGRGSDSKASDFVQTRALDGNEVALAVSIEYRVTDDPSRLPKIVQLVAANGGVIDDIVKSVARADLRTAMNELNTADFLVVEKKYAGQEQAELRMRERLAPWGIEVLRVNLKDHRFERTNPDGSVDRTYQEKIDEEKVLAEGTIRENERVETVKRQKEKELNEAQAFINRMIQDAEGYKEQAKLRADSYFIARKNEALSKLAKGEAEVKGIKEKIAALNGPGGVELLKLRIVEELLKNDPQFVVLNSGDGKKLDLNTMDTNQLLDQLGIAKAVSAGGQLKKSRELAETAAPKEGE